MFIDFGAGFYVEKLLTRYALQDPDEYILCIDAISDVPAKFTGFLEITDKYYTKEGSCYFKKKEPPFKYFDRYITGLHLQDVFALEKKADTWICISTLEHVLEGDVFPVLEGIVNKVEQNSVGRILIDLSDHITYPADLDNCFYHYSDLLFRSPFSAYCREMYKNGNVGIFLNRIRKEEWFTILDTFFTYEIGSDDDIARLSIIDVRLKNS
jgi:hypothetical protein